MKTIKYLFWIIILLLLGVLIYQNLEYFMTTSALSLNLKIASLNWITPELQNIIYLGICFALGFIIAGIKGFTGKFKLNKIIKKKQALIKSLEEQGDALNTELKMFKQDPYIKKALEKHEIVEQAQPEAQKTNNS